MRKCRGLRELNKYEIHCFGWAAVAAAGLSAAGSIAGGAMGASAAEGAAGLQKEYLDLGINELRGALTPSMKRLDKAQAWSDAQLQRQYRGAMGETARYADAGARGLSRLNYLIGTDNGLGPQPTAPTAPKQPKYSKDPKTAAAQKKAYEKAQRIYGRAQTKYDTDSAAWQAGTAAQANDPAYGSLMKPYDDRFEGRTDASGKQILDVAGEKYDDKYANEILGISRDTFDAADFTADPGYEFRRSEGNRGIEQSAAAAGSLQSGAALKELNRFNQDTASNEFDRAHGRWVDQHNRHLTGVTGQQAFDYGAWGDNKNTRLGALAGDRETLFKNREFDFGNWKGNRDFQYGALTDQVGIGERATDDRNQNRQFYSNARTQNTLANATQQGNWQQANANSIAEFLAQQGNAQAAGKVGAANAYSSAFQGIGNTLGTMAGYYYGNQRNGARVKYSPGTY